MRRVLCSSSSPWPSSVSPALLAQAPALRPRRDHARARDRPRPLHGAALLRRDIDSKTLSDYVLDEVEILRGARAGPRPFARMRYEYTWYVRDGVHVRSPVKFNGVPIGETERRAYEDRWVKSEEGRRKFRTEREAKREQAGKGPALSAPSINEPRFISESYFMDFKFEPGNYFLAGKETLEGQQVLKIDYLPTEALQRRPRRSRRTRGSGRQEAEAKAKDAKDAKKDAKDEKPKEKKRRQAVGEGAGEGEEVRAGHRAQDEQVLAGHALGRSDDPPDREVHVRQRVAGLPARPAGS